MREQQSSQAGVSVKGVLHSRQPGQLILQQPRARQPNPNSTSHPHSPAPQPGAPTVQHLHQGAKIQMQSIWWTELSKGFWYLLHTGHQAEPSSSDSLVPSWLSHQPALHCRSLL